MTLVDYLEVFRRRWRLVVAVTAAAVALAWLTAPTPPEPGVPTQPRASSYRAAHTLLVDRELVSSSEASPSADLPLLAFLAQVGEIPRRVAGRLDTDVPPAVLAARVQVESNDEVGALTVTATGTDPDETEKLADTYAEEIIRYAGEEAAARRRAALERSREAARAQRERLRELDKQLDGVASGSIQAQLLTTERDALLAALGEQLQRVEQLSADPSAASALYTLEGATAVPAGSTGPLAGFEPPTSRSGRLLTGGLVGLLLGLGLSLLVEHVDTRIHTRREAEWALGFSVVAEIPRRGWLSGRRNPVVTDRQDTPEAEAYARLRMATRRVPRWVLRPPSPTAGADGQLGKTGSGAARQVGGTVRTILVTSPSQGEGKTSTTANLGACFARAGERTIVVDADSPSPQLARVLPGPGKPRGTDPSAAGRSPAPAADPGRPGRPAVQPTDIPGLEVASWSGTAGALGRASRVADVVRWARRRADVVVIDAGPLLSSTDSLALLPEVDAVVVLIRAGKTTEESARLAREYLAQLQAPVLGVALFGASTVADWFARPAWLNTPDRRGPRPRLQRSPTEAHDDGKEGLRTGSGENSPTDEPSAADARVTGPGDGHRKPPP